MELLLLLMEEMFITPQFQILKMVYIGGIGVGLRYYTQFGPLRVDIAFPLRKRAAGVDKAYQLYFSIGQAF